MQLIFDTPMKTNGVKRLLCAEIAVGNVKAFFNTADVINNARTFNFDNIGQISASWVLFFEPLNIVDDITLSFFNAAMPFGDINALMLSWIISALGKIGHHIILQRSLVAFQRQHVIRLFVANSGRYVFLEAQDVNGDNRTCDI